MENHVYSRCTAIKKLQLGTHVREFRVYGSESQKRQLETY